MRKKGMCLAGIAVVLALFVGAALQMANAADKTKQKKVLVAYFSATGTTEGAAKKVQKAVGGTLFQIEAEDPYTSADLDYGNGRSRATVEQQDGTARPEVKKKVKNIRTYDVIFVGYPIWWGKEPMIIRTFLESYNLKGKKIVPFCTSGGSGISGSMDEIKESAKGAKVGEGKDLTGLSYKSVAKWAKKKIK